MFVFGLLYSMLSYSKKEYERKILSRRPANNQIRLVSITHVHLLLSHPIHEQSNNTEEMLKITRMW